MSDDNIIKFRKPPPPKTPRRPFRLSPWVIVILGALAIGAVTFVLDQQTGTNPPQAADE